jgi:hypothetical protein
MGATRRDFLCFLSGLATLPLLPGAALGGDGDALPSSGTEGDVLLYSRTGRRLYVLRAGRILRRVGLAPQPGHDGLADGVYMLTASATRAAAANGRSGRPVALFGKGNASPSPLILPRAFLTSTRATLEAAGTPMIVVDRAHPSREVMAVSRLPAWPGPVAVAGWLADDARGKPERGQTGKPTDAATMLLVVGAERSIHLIRDGRTVARVATALRNPRRPLVSSAHMLTSSLLAGAGAQWLHLASAQGAPSLATQLARLEPLDRPAMAALWQNVGPGTVLVITDQREDEAGELLPLLARATPPGAVNDADASPTATSKPPRSRVRRATRKRRSRALRRTPRPAEPVKPETFPPTREPYPGAHTVSEYG